MELDRRHQSLAKGKGKSVPANSWVAPFDGIVHLSKRESIAKPCSASVPGRMQIFFNKVSALEVEAQDTVESVKVGIQVGVVVRAPIRLKAATLATHLSLLLLFTLCQRPLSGITSQLVLMFFAGKDGYPVLLPAAHLCGQAAAG